MGAASDTTISKCRRAVPVAGGFLGAWLVLFALAAMARADVVSFVSRVDPVTLASQVSLLSDSFENQTIGSGRPLTANMSPFATNSSWSDSSNPERMFVTTEQASEGSKSLKLTRTAGTFTRLNGTYANQSSGTLDVNLMVYVPSPGAKPLPSILLYSNWSSGYNAPNASYVTMVAADNPGTPGTAVDSFALFVGMGPAYGAGTPGYTMYSPTLWNAFKTDTWQRWRITHTIGTSTADFSIDGVSQSWTSPGATVSFNGLEFSGSGSGTGAYYVDAAVVPEPSSGLLLGSGLALLAWWRRRRHTREVA
jgi:hypothetical protein